MNGEEGFLDETLGMMESGYDSIFPMPGDGSYQCPRCGRTGNRADLAADAKGGFSCPECGRSIPL